MPPSPLRPLGSTPPRSVTAPSDGRLRLIVAASVASLSLLVALLGGPVTAIVAILIAACILQGLWRGASEILGVLVGMFVAALLCQPIGRACEGAVASIAGTSGLANRFISIAVAAVVIAATVSAVASFALKRLWKSRQHAWMKWDHLLGGGVGLVEGAMLSFVVLWAPLTLEPIASAQATLQTVDATAEPSVARRVADWAGAVRASPLGGLASATNPASSSPMVQLLEDFVFVARDPEAMEHFLNSEPIQRLRNLPSVGDAIRRLEADPQLTGLITGASPSPSNASTAAQRDDANASPPITADTIRAILASNTLLTVLDETTILHDLTPLAPDIGTALREAKAIISRKGLAPPSQPLQRNPGGG